MKWDFNENSFQSWIEGYRQPAAERIKARQRREAKKDIAWGLTFCVVGAVLIPIGYIARDTAWVALLVIGVILAVAGIWITGSGSGRLGG